MIDVLVIGGGNAALCAALMAREEGTAADESRIYRVALLNLSNRPASPCSSRDDSDADAADPRKTPVIRPNHLATDEDKDFFVRAVRKVREVLATSPMDQVISEEYLPDKAVTTDEQILDYVGKKSNTIYHPCGTCRMGSDLESVVDPALRVRGVEGLRIADASIIPRITSGNINATCLMIG